MASSPETGAILASSPEAGAIVPEDHLLKYVLKPPGRRRTSSGAPPHGTQVNVNINREGYIKGILQDGDKANMTSFFLGGGDIQIYRFIGTETEAFLTTDLSFAEYRT